MFYGVDYRSRGGNRGSQANFAPSPGGGGGGKGRGRTSAPSAPGRGSRGKRMRIPPVGYADHLGRELRKAFNPYRKAKIFYKFSKFYLDEIWQPVEKPKDAGWEYDEGYSCVSYRRFGPPADECNDGMQVVGRRITSAQKCSTWHYQAQAIPSSSPSNANFFTAGRLRGGAYGCVRYDHELVIQYPASKPTPIAPPRWVLPRPPQFWPSTPYPQTHPEEAPIGRPGHPVPTPYPMLPKVPDSPFPQGRKTAQPSGPVPGRVDPVADPGAGPSIEVDPGGIRPGEPHRNAPPGPYDKEKKGKASAGEAAGKAIADKAGQAAEAADAIGAVYDALPERVKQKCKAKTPAQKLKCLYHNAGDIDVAAAAANLAKEKAQDEAFGKAGKALGKASAKNPVWKGSRGRGIQTGGAGRRYGSR